MNDLKGKNIIVTGASGGIGNSIIEKLNQSGANILASGTKIEKLEELKGKYKNLLLILGIIALSDVFFSARFLPTLALLNQYKPLFELLDALLMIRVPSMETVYKSRWLQESKLWKKHQSTGDKTGLKGLMTEEQTRQYVQLFERLTEHMLSTMPEQSDILIQCGDSFDYKLARLPK